MTPPTEAPAKAPDGAVQARAPDGAGPAGWRLVHRPVVDSTQAVARTLLEAGEGSPVWPDGALVVQADEQTGGRGRHGRPWTSPPGNLYVTVALPCPEGPRVGVQIGFLGGVALAEALGQLGFEDRARLKWPNDLLLDQAKVAGLLPESARDSDDRTWVLLGMGVNVATAPPPDAVLYPTTTLNAHGLGVLAPEDLLPPLLTRLAEGVRRWRAEGFAPVRAAWRRHGHGVGDPVRVRLGAETVTGVFAGLAADGALMIRDPGGAMRTILAGDVFFPARQGDA